ncbi:protein FAM136A-like [Sturnira hondurensis]|uniref:protein FAM136A-like n=1 Tax=Sturnira hondurensis TaxID=192404 RepID=UPI00187A072E|nr:protein FAM136A-like [Sturnira hondurensis]
MADLQQLWVQEAVDSMVKSLERENIQKMQGLVSWCSAGCCEASMQQAGCEVILQHVHQCIEPCHMTLVPAQAMITSELKKFQNCLAQCTMHCNDKAKCSTDTGSTELHVKQQLGNCVIKYVDTHCGYHVNLIPTMTKKMK